MTSIDDQLGKDKLLNITLLKQMLLEEKKLPRTWLKTMTEQFIAITSTPPPTQKTIPM